MDVLKKVFLRKAGTEPSSGLSLAWNFLYFQIDIIRLDLSVFCSLVMFCVNRVRMEQFDLKMKIDLRSKLDSIRTDSDL
jgi:hypothetical protein